MGSFSVEFMEVRSGVAHALIQTSSLYSELDDLELERTVLEKAQSISLHFARVVITIHSPNEQHPKVIEIVPQ
jgi:hypothetical protein